MENMKKQKIPVCYEDWDNSDLEDQDIMEKEEMHDAEYGKGHTERVASSLLTLKVVLLPEEFGKGHTERVASSLLTRSVTPQGGSQPLSTEGALMEATKSPDEFETLSADDGVKNDENIENLNSTDNEVERRMTTEDEPIREMTTNQYTWAWLESH